jgi:peptidoglycan/LPS O-acetylase OafA/YrhL
MTQRHLPHVDALRGIAIALVVVFHAFPAALPGGFIGIDIFFVISGFVITRQIIERLDGGAFSYRDFVVRRIFRLVPAAVACLLATTLAAIWLLTPDELELYARSVIAVVLIGANFFFYRNSDYFSPEAHEMPLQHTWSLAVEEQFYLVWPLAIAGLWLLAAGRRRPIVAIAAVLLVLSLAGAQFAVDRDPSFAYYMLPTRAWELLAGCLLALAPLRIASRAVAGAAALIGFVAIMVSAFLLDARSGVPGLPALPAVAGTAALILAGGQIAGLAGAVLQRGLLVWLGLISYSLYLWHWPLFSLWQIASGRELSLAEGLLLIAIALAIASLSWRFVETPLRRLPSGSRFRLLPHTGAVIGSALATGAVAGLVIAGDGWPWRYDGKARGMLEQMATNNELRSVCDGHENALRREERCNIGVPKPATASFDMVLLGDSLADQFTALGAVWAQQKGYSARQVTNSACGFVIGAQKAGPPASRRDCEAYHLTVIDFLDKNPNVKLAVVASRWSGYYGVEEANRAAAHIGLDGANATFEDYVAASIRMLRSRGITVVVMGEAPSYDRLPVRCVIAASADPGRADRCGLPAQPFRHKTERGERLFKRMASEDAGILYHDIGRMLCDETRCSPVKDGIFFYRDRGHFNADAARHLAGVLPPPP